MKNRIKVVQGDITKEKVVAIVNAANTSLLGGGGVDGAIHRAAGPKLKEECRLLGGCHTGEAKMTRGYKLKAKYVIHTVGPRWTDGHHNEPELLASCYRNSLKIAADNNIKTIAFPAISTGVYRFPIEKAAGIAVHEVFDFLNNNQSIEKVIFVCFSSTDYEIYNQIIEKERN